MLTLAFDTSQRIVTSAILRAQDGAVSVLATLNSKEFLAQNQGESLNPQVGAEFPRTAPGTSAITIPIIQAAIEAAGVRAEELDLIAFSKGPGLFTGLRVGVVVGKIFGFSLKKPIVAVNSLEVCAQEMVHRNGISDGNTILSVCNAQRKQLFAGRFDVLDSQVKMIDKHELVQRQAWIEAIGPNDFLTGPGLEAIRGELNELPEMSDDRIAAEDVCGSDAVSVGKLAISKFELGLVDDPWKIEPIYFRPSAAEEMRNS